jgi:hypothetical protein
MLPAVAGAAAGFAWLLRRSGRAARLAAAAAPGLAAATVAWGAVAVAAALQRPTFTIRDTARSLRSGGEKVLTGDLANTFSLETPFRAFASRDLAHAHLGSGWVNADWRALGATHWLGDTPPGRIGIRQPAPSEAVLESVHGLWPDRSDRPRRSLYVSRLPAAALGSASAPGQAQPVVERDELAAEAREAAALHQPEVPEQRRPHELAPAAEVVARALAGEQPQTAVGGARRARRDDDEAPVRAQDAGDHAAGGVEVLHELQRAHHDRAVDRLRR